MHENTTPVNCRYPTSKCIPPFIVVLWGKNYSPVVPCIMTKSIPYHPTGKMLHHRSRAFHIKYFIYTCFHTCCWRYVNCCKILPFENIALLQSAANYLRAKAYLFSLRDCSLFLVLAGFSTFQFFFSFKRLEIVLRFTLHHFWSKLIWTFCTNKCKYCDFLSCTLSGSSKDDPSRILF